jgi:hypothetical protein
MNNLYNGMLNGLSKVNLSSFERAQAELHLRRAAAFVGMVMGSREVALAQPAKVEAPVAEREEYRAAA